MRRDADWILHAIEMDKKKPREISQGFVSLNEGDGARTRNLWIDSPVL